MTLDSVPRYDPGGIPRLGDRAVVLGASIAGLCAARVLADGFDRVTVIERDPLPEDPVARDGVPQSSHPHVLLEGGRATLEDLFPGFGEELVSAGGLMLDASTDVHHYDHGDFLADSPGRLPMYCASRALFEHVVREGVADLPAVEFRDECRFTGYLLDDAGERVTGVSVRDDGEEDLAADLVVDATGRTSRTPGWLEDEGFPAPETEAVEVDVTYSTVRVERPPGERRSLFVPPVPPRTRGGVTIPVEGDRWEVIVQGVNGDDAPTDREGFVEFADSLPVAELGRIVRERPWTADEVHHYPFPSNVRRRYDDLDRFPEGLVVTGDAVASFNPVYGQGMSVAALESVLLGHALSEGGLDGVGPRFFDRSAHVVDTAWKLAVGRDLSFPGTTGPKPAGTDLFNRYVSRLLRQAHSDGVLREEFARVFRLEQPVTALLHPRVAWRVLSPMR